MESLRINMSQTNTTAEESVNFPLKMYSFRINETKVTQIIKYTGICAQHKRNKERGNSSLNLSYSR